MVLLSAVLRLYLCASSITLALRTEQLTSPPEATDCKHGSELTAVRCDNNARDATASTVQRACALPEPGSGAQKHTGADALLMCGRSARAGRRPPAALRTGTRLPPAPPSHSSAACCRPSTHRSVLTDSHAHRAVFSNDYGTSAILLLH